MEYRVELRDDPQEKSKSKRLPQPYQAAYLLLKEGKKPARGEVVGFVKVHPFKLQGRQFTVKPTSQANAREVNVGDYVRNLISSLSQTFEPMNITIDTSQAVYQNLCSEKMIKLSELHLHCSYSMSVS